VGNQSGKRFPCCPYAVEVRYPDDALSPLLEDAREARAAAGKIKEFVKKAAPGLFSDP